MQKKMVVLVLGLPGAGKTTAAVMLGEQLGRPALSMGELYRAGQADKATAPASNVEALARELRRDPDKFVHGFVADFSPVSAGAYRELVGVLLECGFDDLRIVYVQVSLQTAQRRLAARPQRPGDRQGKRGELEAQRLREFNSFSEPIIQAMINSLFYLNNEGGLHRLPAEVAGLVTALSWLW